MENSFMSLGLSKSKYCSGIQCPKILWMDAHMPEERVDTASQTVFENGNLIGDLARGYFGEYALVEYSADKKVMVEETKKLIAEGASNIAEASFFYDGLYCAVDILHKNGDGWDIDEVKSSTEVREIYVDDMAFQYYVLTNAGINVIGVFNMHVNKDYVFHNKFDIKSYFSIEDFTDDCKSKRSAVEENVKAFRAYVAADAEPVRDITASCLSPYECPYKAYCWRDIPEPSIFDIGRLAMDKKFAYYEKKIISYPDIIKAGSQVKLNEKQKLQVDTGLGHLPDTINKVKIKEFLDTLTYPVYHLDFEAFQPIIPKWEGCKAYGQIPFQYSLHIEYADGRLEHKEFLAKEGEDPRRSLAEQLCRDIPQGVCCLAYNMSFENTVLRDLAALFPDLAGHLLSIRDHMHDLLVSFQRGYYYSVAMGGSCSIKKVLPALYPDDPELDYHSLEDVHQGDEASTAFATLADQSPEDIKRIRASLLKYCGLDTYAMVKLLAKLREAAK